MDASVAHIVDYASRVKFSDLPPDAVHQCKRCLVDTVGCALGAFDAEPSRIARRLAQRVSVDARATVIGTSLRTLPELAAFANGVMARYLDGSDTYPGGGGHPSDLIPAVLAAAEISGANGQSIITAITLGYEVFHKLWLATHFRTKGLDNVFYGSVGGAAGAAKVMGFDRERFAQTLSLAIVPNVPLDATRYGDVAMWKGCAGGNAARNAVFAALLAAEGMTGPDKSLEGAHGLANLVGDFKLGDFAQGQAFSINEATFKCFLSEGHSLSPITTALALSKEVKVDEIKSVSIGTYHFALDVIGRGPEKWRPRTREAADHSMPYVVAAALIDGDFSDEVFSDERLSDPRIRDLMDKISINEDPGITARFPSELACRIEVTTHSGERKVATTDYPRGHPRNPMTDQELNDKFRKLAQRALPKHRIESALDALWRLDSASDISGIFAAVKRED